MSTTPRLFRFRLEHQTPPAWPVEVVTHDECSRHLRKLSQTACGCMRYGTQRDRPYGKIWAASGQCTETNIARLFVTMSADRPLQGTDYALHRCDDPLCAHPDHLRVGTHHSNILDQFHPGRRIRPRREARFYDAMLAEIAATPIIVKVPAPRCAVTGRYLPTVPPVMPTGMLLHSTPAPTSFQQLSAS